VHKETQLWCLTPSTSVCLIATLQVWFVLRQQHRKSRQNPKPGNAAYKAMHRLLQSIGKLSLGLMEELLRAGTSS